MLQKFSLQQIENRCVIRIDIRYICMMTREDAAILYDSFSRRLYNSALRIVGDSCAAQEIMHDTLLKFIEKGVRTESEQQKSAWLTRTCIRMSIDWLRRRKSEMLMMENLPALEEEGDATTEFDDELAREYLRVKDEILLMPPPHGLILTLVLLDGLDYEEIAQVTGEKEVTIRSQFCRAKKKLIENLRENGLER